MSQRLPAIAAVATTNVLAGGEPVSTFKEADRQYDVWLRAERRFRDDPDEIARLTVPSRKPGTAVVELGNVARFEEAQGPSTIERFARQRQVVVSANLEGKALGEGVTALGDFVRTLDLPADYRWEFIGQAKSLKETNANFLVAFGLAFLFMYMILAAQFESLVHPITILLALPLTVPFAILSLILLRTSLDIYAMFGLFMLFGIVKKNGILQVDSTNVLRARGMPRDRAILEANAVRLRPILMTTVMLVAAMVPMALGKGPGAASRAGMAKVILGGQALSLLLTLLVTPVAYSLWDDLEQLLGRWFGGGQAAGPGEQAGGGPAAAEGDERPPEEATLLHPATRSLLGAGLAILAALPAGHARAADRPPNVVFIMADDLGWTDLGCFGSRYYETPAIDRLAADGMRLSCHHHCQNCTPTRAALMSGQVGARTGVYTVGGVGRFDWSMRPLVPVENVEKLPLRLETIADRLRAAGYATALFGKWHLGEQGPHHPSRRGFDEAIVTMGRHFDFKTDPPTPHRADAYLADFLTNRAVDFIRRHKDRPFFLYLPHFGVHSPHEAKPELVARFEKKAPAGGHHDPRYAAMIASVDESVGRVTAVIDELGLGPDTVIVFTSDNGGVGGYDREGIAGQRGITDNAPLRSGKGSLYEGGTRVPLIVRWPGVVRAGTTSDVPTIHVDVYPTLLEITGATPPRQTLDGESLVPLLRDPTAGLRRAAIFQHFPGYLGIGKNKWRTTPVSTVQAGDWKLLEFLEDGRLELYNLRDDVGETSNLAATMPQKAAELHDRLVAWRREVKAPMPTPNDGQPAKPQRGKQRAGAAGRGGKSG